MRERKKQEGDLPKATPFADVRSYLPAQDQWSECPLSEHGTWEPPWAPSPRSQPQAPSALPAAHPGSCPCSLREPVQGALHRPAWEGAFPGPPGGSHVLVMKTEARMRVTFFRKTRHSECPHVGGVRPAGLLRISAVLPETCLGVQEVTPRPT